MLSYKAKDLHDCLEPWPFTGAGSDYRIISGAPQATGRLDVGRHGAKHRAGVWACTKGAFECTESGDELQTIITGRLRVIHQDGRTFEFGPGDSFFSRKGERVIWEILDDVKKVFFNYDCDGDE